MSAWLVCRVAVCCGTWRHLSVVIIVSKDRLLFVRQPILSDGARGRYGGKCSARGHEVSHKEGNVSKSSRRAEAARNQVAPAAEDFVHAAADRVGPLVHNAAERVGPLAQCAATRAGPRAEAAADLRGH